jgi:hypothetical protein
MGFSSKAKLAGRLEAITPRVAIKGVGIGGPLGEINAVGARHRIAVLTITQ